jgi:acyl-CoA thioesterase FadM
MARRLNTVRRASDSTTVAVALVDWIFTENGTTPVRIPDELKNAFPALGRPVAPVALEEGRPPQDAARIPVHIRASDVDAMGHANNAVYVDLLDDAVARAEDAKIVETHPRTYDLQYSGAATAGATLRGVAWRDGDRRHYQLERPDGTLLLHGTLAAAQAPIAEARDATI